MPTTKELDYTVIRHRAGTVTTYYVQTDEDGVVPRSKTFEDATLTTTAQQAGKTAWDEAELLAEVPGLVWVRPEPSVTAASEAV